MTEYVRPVITAEEADLCLKTAKQIVAVRGRLQLSVVLVALMGENLKLTKEVNIHREKLGYEPLPIHELKI